MVYVIFILALIIIGFTSSETMFSDSTLGKSLKLIAIIAALVCIIIFVVKIFKFIF